MKIVNVPNQNSSLNADDEFNVSLTYNLSLTEPTITNLSNNSCPACQNNDQPTNAHICYLCQKPVHALPQCSSVFNDSEEGYGQHHICMTCKNVGNI